MKYVHYGDIHTSVANEIGKNNNLPFINETYKESDELKLDDVIVADASEDYKGIADAAVIIDNLPYTIIAGLHTIALRPTSLIKGYFLYYIFKTENFKRFGYKIGTGLKVFGISYNNLAKYKVYYPQEIEEQEKIIGILSNLTNSINLHERKCEELALIKKALLQNLFPKKDEIKPEVRYKNFSDAWEQRKLGEVATRVRGNDGRMNLPTLTISAASGWLDQRERFSGNIAGKEQKNYTLLSEGELSYNHGNSKLAKYGTVFVLRNYKEALVPRVYHSFKADSQTSADFIEYIFSTKRTDRELSKLITSGARIDGLLNINFDNFMSIKINLPLYDEQLKIVKFLREFDSLITLHQRKLEKLKQLKKFLLQNMFI
ncbi:restriction endonuclease subunit S [Ligilactobacillus salivarius]|uniref:restriction endonuclease subunit S n=1 Tax=Ligilactobacillus salivarius TaxID=1624 RepID=UPI003C2D8B62